MLFVAVDIGCIECGEPSNVIGVFTDKEQAEQALAVHEKHQSEHWSGQHDFEIFEVSDLNKVSELPNE